MERPHRNDSLDGHWINSVKERVCTLHELLSTAIVLGFTAGLCRDTEAHFRELADEMGRFATWCSGSLNSLNPDSNEEESMASLNAKMYRLYDLLLYASFLGHITPGLCPDIESQLHEFADYMGKLALAPSNSRKAPTLVQEEKVNSGP